MENCTACGLPLKEGQRRCLHCGEPVAGGERGNPAGKRNHALESICGKCGALLPSGCEACLVCGTKRDEIPFDGKFPVSAEEAPRPEPYPHREGSVSRAIETPRRWGAILTLLLLLVVAVFTGFGVWRQYFDKSGYRAAETLIYEAGDGVVRLSHPGLAAPVTVDGATLGGGEPGSTTASPNGRYLAFVNGAGELFRVDLAETADSDLAGLAATRLAENVEGAVFFAENSAALAYRTADGDLYATDYEEHWLLDTDVDSIAALESRRLLYTREEGGRTDLYLGVLGAGRFSEVSPVYRDVVEILDWTPGFGRILFTANLRGKEEPAVGLLSYESEGRVSEVLAEGVAAVLSASAADKTAFYLVEAKRSWSVGQFVNDDLADEDDELIRPLITDYPALVEAIELYGKDADLTEVAESEEPIIAKNAYDSAMKLWNERTERVNLRRELRTLFRKEGEHTVFELWFYGAGGGVRLDGDVLFEETPREGAVDAKSGFAIYRRTNPASLRKASLSDLWRGAEPMLRDLAAYYERNSREELRYARSTGETTSLFLESASLCHRLWFAVKGGSGVYFTVGPANDEEAPGEMFYARMDGENAGAASVAEEVSRFYGGYRDGLVYGSLAGEEESLGVVSVAEDGSVASVSLAARFAGLENGGQALLSFDRNANEPGREALTLREGGIQDAQFTAPRLVAEGVVRYDYRNSGLVYFEKDTGGGNPPDLYIWRGGEARLLEKHPTLVLHPEGKEPPPFDF